MSGKKSGSKSGKAKNQQTQKPKQMEVSLAPGTYRLLQAERDQRNSSPEVTSEVSSFSDIVNEALLAFLQKADSQDRFGLA
jgi:hypothetical protein